jgi:hypothetical protein
MKFIKKLFKKQKKEIGACGIVETTIYLDDNDFKSCDFEVKTVRISDSGSYSIGFSEAIVEGIVGGSGGSSPFQFCPHCGKTIDTFDGSSGKV